MTDIHNHVKTYRKGFKVRENENKDETKVNKVNLKLTYTEKINILDTTCCFWIDVFEQ